MTVIIRILDFAGTLTKLKENASIQFISEWQKILCLTEAKRWSEVNYSKQFYSFVAETVQCYARMPKAVISKNHDNDQKFCGALINVNYSNANIIHRTHDEACHDYKPQNNVNIT